MKKENIDIEEDLNGDSSQDLQDLESFKKKFIDTHRGRPIFMVRIEDIKGISLIDFINLLKTEIHRFPDIKFYRSPPKSFIRNSIWWRSSG